MSGPLLGRSLQAVTTSAIKARGRDTTVKVSFDRLCRTSPCRTIRRRDLACLAWPTQEPGRGQYLGSQARSDLCAWGLGALVRCAGLGESLSCVSASRRQDRTNQGQGQDQDQPNARPKARKAAASLSLFLGAPRPRQCIRMEWVKAGACIRTGRKHSYSGQVGPAFSPVPTCTV